MRRPAEARPVLAAYHARRSGAFALAIIAVVYGLYRLRGVAPEAALAALMLAAGIAVLALVLAAVALITLWNREGRGASSAFIGGLIGVAITGLAAFVIITGSMSPGLIDIATDPDHPPGFDLAREGRAQRLPLDTPDAERTAAQRAALPKFKSVVIDRRLDTVYGAALLAAELEGWHILGVSPLNPATNGADRVRIEMRLIEPTLFLPHDAVLILSRFASKTRVDLRMTSWLGTESWAFQDFGLNARLAAKVLEAVTFHSELEPKAESDL